MELPVSLLHAHFSNRAEQDQMHSVSDRHAALNRTKCTVCQTDTHFTRGPNAQCVRQTCPLQTCLKTLHCTAGEWFCPRCKSELELYSSNEPMHSSLVPTRLMRQEDCYRSLAAALGMPPAQSDCCHMCRPLCPLTEPICCAQQLYCTELCKLHKYCISCAVLHSAVLFCNCTALDWTVLLLYCTVLHCQVWYQ